VGQTGTFQCYGGERITWLFNDGDLPDNVVITTNFTILRIVDVIVENEGYYECVGYELYSHKRFRARGYLSVFGNSYIYITWPFPYF